MSGKGGGKGGKTNGPGGGQRLMHTRVKTASKRTPSSQRWLARQLNDPYVAASKRDGMRSRAAYKLREIDDKYHFLRPGQRVVDLGAAPGGWSQIAAERVKALLRAAPEPAPADEAQVEAVITPAPSSPTAGSAQHGQVVAIDYLGVDPLPGVEILQLDFTAPGAEEELKRRLHNGRADVVLSDMAAPTVGHARTDHLRIIGLAEQAATFACEVLTPGGTFLCKVLQGGTERDLLDILKRSFATVRHIKPPASRADSAELYVLATGFRGELKPSA